MAQPPNPVENYQLLQANSQITVQKNGSFSETVTRVIAPLTPAGVASQSQFSIFYPANFAHVQVLYAYTETPQKRRYLVPKDAEFSQSTAGALHAPFLSDGRQLSLVFPNVAPGDTLHVRYRIDYQHAYLPGIYAASMLIAPNIALLRGQVSLQVPAGEKIYSGVQGHHWHRHSDSNGESYSTQLLHVSYPPAGSPALSEFSPLAVLSTAPNWQVIAQAYNQLAQPAMRISPNIQNLARKIAGSDSGIAAVRKIYLWFQRHMHSVSVNYADAGFRPLAASATLARGLGDSNSNAALLCAMLHAVRIPAVPAMLSTNARFHLWPAPSPFAFSHFLVYLPQQKLFLDPSVRHHDIDQLPIADAGRPVLITGSQPQILRTPMPSLSTPLVVTRSTIQLHRNGDGNLLQTSWYRGYLAAQTRGGLAGLHGRLLWKSMASSFYTQGNLGQLQDIAFAQRRESQKPLGIRIRASTLGLFPPGKRIALTPVNLLDHGLLAFTGQTQRQQASLLTPTRQVSVTRLVLPTGYQPVFLPHDEALHSAVGDYRLTYRFLGKVLTIRQALTLPNFLVSAKDFPLLHQLATTCSRASRTVILLQRH
ncbi:DUF3857 domain-containing protein [Acidithiobacillus sp. IBUN Pt1247-S3]|uniref:DUF3857 domain-containing protein n=1 Tax=Acidithiobacillus sp. IBUN Pt1247-S3 TaxID=3166642 RepID=UPI0034E412FD